MFEQGEHSKHRGVSDPERLGTVERYFVEIMEIPRLGQRIQCFIFTRTFASAMQQARPPILPPSYILAGRDTEHYCCSQYPFTAVFLCM